MANESVMSFNVRTCTHTCMYVHVHVHVICTMYERTILVAYLAGPGLVGLELFSQDGEVRLVCSQAFGGG